MMQMNEESSTPRSLPPERQDAGNYAVLRREARAVALQKDAEKIKAADQVRRDASDKAMRVYDLLGTEKEGPGLNQAMTQAMHLDKSQISPLEARAIEDRAAGMKQKMADMAL